MKKRWKVFWIVCAVAGAVGLVCCAAAFALGVTADMINERLPDGIGIMADHTDAEDYLHEDGEHLARAEDFKDHYAGVSKIDMEIFAGDVRVVPADGIDAVQVEAVGVSRKLGLRSYMEEGELCITSKENLHGINGVGIGTITVTVPRDMKIQEASFSMKAGMLHVEDICASKLDIDIGAGEAVIDHFEADEADLDCGTGSATASGNVVRKLDIDCGVGEVSATLEGHETEYNYKIDCGVGEVNIGESSYSGLGASKKIENHAHRIVKIDCGIGSVDVKFAEHEHL